MVSLPDDLAMVRAHCRPADLATRDPYDIWKTPVGFWAKNLYNHRPALGALPAGILTLADHFARPLLAWAYERQEYPVVRAFAAMALMAVKDFPGGEEDLCKARAHLDWLAENACREYGGVGWGIGFRYPVSRGLVYGPEMPMVTNTPYVLEAMLRYDSIIRDGRYSTLIIGVAGFLEKGLKVMLDEGGRLALSYGPLRDRVVVNAQTYAMHAYAQVLPFLAQEEHDKALHRIAGLWAFVRSEQQSDGSWYYAPGGRSFIDCFHSAIVLRNLIKTQRLVGLPGCEDVIARGYAFLKAELLDPATGLFRRFAVARRPGLVAFDLYDNAEMLNLAVLMDDSPLAESLAERIRQTFVMDGVIFSQLDRFGVLRMPGTLRWAVMPYLNALATLRASDLIRSPRG